MKELLFIISSALTVFAWPVIEPESSEWELFKSRFNKKYGSEAEENFRFKIYMDNKRKIEMHNAKYERGEVTYTLGTNKFSDLLHSEVIDTYTGYKVPKDSSGRVFYDKFNEDTYVPPENDVLPDEVNWITKGAVTPVKNQEDCGSCWAFSATGSLEGLNFLKTGKLISLSEQNLVDCSRSEGNEGCKGGLPSFAFRYVKINHGIDTEESYPYLGEDGQCRFQNTTIGATDNGFVKIPNRSEDDLKSAVANVGPISVGICVMGSFVNYREGVLTKCSCTEEDIDHGVVVVGYGTDNTTNQDYWLVKNSWGPEWGEMGYIRIARGNNECCIASVAVYPKV